MFFCLLRESRVHSSGLPFLLNTNVYMCLFKSLPFIELISSRNVIAKWKFNSKTTPAASR
nr:MAG TPA: hypothetical protein [Caudoviricetes sp.]